MAARSTTAAEMPSARCFVKAKGRPDWSDRFVDQACKIFHGEKMVFSLTNKID